MVVYIPDVIALKLCPLASGKAVARACAGDGCDVVSLYGISDGSGLCVACIKVADRESDAGVKKGHKVSYRIAFKELVIAEEMKAYLG